MQWKREGMFSGVYNTLVCHQEPWHSWARLVGACLQQATMIKLWFDTVGFKCNTINFVPIIYQKATHGGSTVGARCLVSSLPWRHNGRDSFSNQQSHDCLHNRLFRHISKKTSKLRVRGLCVGNSPGTGEFPTQMTSSAENVSIWWCHHVLIQSLIEKFVYNLCLSYWYPVCNILPWLRIDCSSKYLPSLCKDHLSGKQ